MASIFSFAIGPEIRRDRSSSPCFNCFSQSVADLIHCERFCCCWLELLRSLYSFNRVLKVWECAWPLYMTCNCLLNQALLSLVSLVITSRSSWGRDSWLR